MGKTTYKAQEGLAELLIRAMNPVADEVNPLSAFKAAGLPKDTRKDSKPEVSGRDLK